ncbi:MAG TPA: response regulator [Nitrospirales bacterium]|nr:response regulator [Nitrospirales bacterium]
MNKPFLYVVDDDEVVRRSIVKRLIRLNCTVRDFESGEALLHSLEHLHEIPDVILLDYKMKGMNGIETLKSLRKTHSVIPAFIFTAYAGEKDLSLVEKLGNCEVLLKTVDLHGLRHVVNGAMAIKNLRMRECADC